MNKLHKEIKKRGDEIESMTDLYSAPLAMSLPPYFNSSRKIIYAHNASHGVGLTEPDMPMVYTGFEKVFGAYSEMYEKAETDFEIIDKIVRNKYHYILVVKYLESGIYDVIERRQFEEFSEGYATKYNNTYLDSLKIGDTVEEGITYKKSLAFDEHDNYRVGKNLNTIYTISTSTEEDCIKLMNGAEKKMDTYVIHTIKVPLNRDEVMINHYGDKGNYRPFPKVGEKTKDGILLGIRKIPNNSLLYSGKDKALMRFAQGDAIRYIEGRVIDFNIYNNNPISELPESQAYDQIRELSTEQLNFYHEVYNIMHKLLQKHEDGKIICGDEVRYWYTKSLKFIDSSAYFTDMDNVFGHIVMEFKIMQKRHLVPGSKLTGLYGNKGVIGQIVAPEYSWKTETGKPVHVVVDMLGVPGRLNIGQLSTPYLSYIGDRVKDRIILYKNKELSIKDLTEEVIDEVVEIMKEEEDQAKRFKILADFFDVIDTPDKEYIVEHFKNLTPKKQKIFMEKVIRHGIYIMQDPSLPTTVEQMEEATKRYDIQPERIVFPDGSKSLRKVIVAPGFWIRLKQDPIDKYSCRGRSVLNPITHLPAKSYDKRNYLTMYSNSAVQFGTFETNLLQICNDPAAVSLFYAMLSNSLNAKDSMARLYEEELTPELLHDIVYDIHTGQRKNLEILSARLYQLGIEMDIQVRNVETNEVKALKPTELFKSRLK